MAVVELLRNRRDPDRSMRLHLRGIEGNTTHTDREVTAWYRLPAESWAFRPDGEREDLITAIAMQFAALAGCRLHLRRTNIPFPIGTWAREHAAVTRPIGAPTLWTTHMTNTTAALSFAEYTVPVTILGVTVPKTMVGDGVAEWLRAKATRTAVRTDPARLAARLDDVTQVLATSGLRARPATESDLAWLVYRSVAHGLDLPDEAIGVDAESVLALTDTVDWYRTPLGSTVQLVHRLTGQERHVAVLTVGRVDDLEIPQVHQPWLHLADQALFPMEMSSRVTVLGPGDASRELTHRLLMIRSQQRDFREKGLDVPPELERTGRLAVEIGDEMDTGQPVDASRVHGWHRIAVAGATEEECLDRVRTVKALYGAHPNRIQLRHPKGQPLLAREFVPGEPNANTGFKRRMPVKMFAAAMPQAAPLIGDRRGDLIGYTVGAGRLPVFLDLHFPMEVRDGSGLAVFVAEPGAGKSTLIGALGYLAARRGVQTTLLDPSGPLAALCALPELAGHTRVVNLSGAQPGTLAPYALIPTPRRAVFDGTADGYQQYENAIKYACGERRAFVHDICLALLPPQVARSGDAITVLQDAIRAVPPEETSTLDDVVAVLRGMSEPVAARVAGSLIDAADMPLAGALFGQPPAGAFDSDTALTVITMAGLRLPEPTVAREDWSIEEAHAMPMLHTAYRLAVRRCYGGDMHARKLVGLDEAHFMQRWPSGRSFLVRLARDCRKWNLAALVASQNPADILGLDVQNLVSTVFVGRIVKDKQIAVDALRLLGVDASVGYEQTLAGLSQVDAASLDRLRYREFLLRDVDDRVQKVRVNFDHVPGLLRALNTTPGGGQ